MKAPYLYAFFQARQFWFHFVHSFQIVIHSIFLPFLYVNNASLNLVAEILPEPESQPITNKATTNITNIIIQYFFT